MDSDLFLQKPKVRQNSAWMSIIVVKNLLHIVPQRRFLMSALFKFEDKLSRYNDNYSTSWASQNVKYFRNNVIKIYGSLPTPYITR